MLDPSRLADQFKDVQSLSDLTDRTIRVVRDAVSISGVNAFIFPATSDDIPHVHIWSDEYPEAFMSKVARDALVRIDGELGTAIEISARNRACFDVDSMFGSLGIEIRRTSVYADFWRRTKVERQALAYLGPPGRPTGFLCAIRKHQARAFTPEELRDVGLVREAMEHTLEQLAPPPLAATADLLGLLSRDLPVVAAAFDSWGRALWMTSAAAVYFGIDRALEANAHERYCESARLEAWRTLALAALTDPGLAETVDGRRIVARTVGTARGPIVLLRAEGHRTDGSTFALSKREREICELIAQGYDTINVAALLGISIATARLHLKNVYRKLRVANRASLVLRIAAEKGNEPGRGPQSAVVSSRRSDSSTDESR